MPRTAETRSRRSWEPDHDDHLIYWWVKFQGKSQAWVANDMGIHQGTVSRVIQRYERWQARTELHDRSRLTREERLRAQRWLTYERNELILASCLRIAGDIEGFVDSSRSTTVRPLSSPSGEREVRAEHFTIDRTGMVSRYLRLAFKINMEQLKLVESDEPPPLPGMTAQQVAAEEEAAAAARAELAAVREQRRHEIAEEARARQEAQQATERALGLEADPQRELQNANCELQSANCGQADASGNGTSLGICNLQLITNLQSTGEPSESATPPTQAAPGAHNAHNDSSARASANGEEPGTYSKNGRPKKKPLPARMTAAPASPPKNKSRRRGPPALAELQLAPQQPVTLESG
jgi:hypothetical protein